MNMLQLQERLSDHGSPTPTPRSQTELLTKGVMRAPDYEPAQYPDDVVNYRQYIIHEELPENTRQGSQLLVFVRKVNSPSEFWINLSGPMYSAKLNALCHEMRSFYELRHEDYAMPLYAVVFGQFCVCLYRNEWHRARILNVSDSTCEVSLIDFGGTVLMNHENLRFMHKKFSDLPMQSFRAEISDVRPRQSADWSNRVCEWFRMQTSGRRFIAEVKDIYSQKHTLKIKLFDGSRQSISHLLISSDMAEAETSTVKSVCEARELSLKHTASNNILCPVSPLAVSRVSTSKSRSYEDETNIILPSEISNYTLTPRQLLDKQTENKNSVTTASCASLTEVSASKPDLKWDERDVMLRPETCNRPIANVVQEWRQLLNKQSSNESFMTTVSPRALTKVPTSKLRSECDQHESTPLSETSVNGSTNMLHTQITNKSVISTDFSQALRQVSTQKPTLEWDQHEMTPRSETSGNGSTNVLHTQIANKSVISTDFSQALRQVSTPKPTLEWDQHERTPRSETSGNGSTNVLHTQIANESVISTDVSKALRQVSTQKPTLEWDESESAATISSKNSLSIEHVTISGNNLLVVKLEGREHFILSEFVHAFVRLHEHVVLKILEALHSSIRLVKLPETCKWRFFTQLKGRTVIGLNTDYRRQAATIHLLPLCEVNELISFLKLDGSEIEDLQYFLLSLL